MGGRASESRGSVVSTERIESRILLVRGHKVLLDADLAALYGVQTRRLNEQVRRNLARFPADFMFQLTDAEFELLMSQFATSNPGRGGRRKRPLVFTEHGAPMAATVLNSARAPRAVAWVVVPVSGFKAVYPPSGAGISTAVSIMIGAPDAQANGALSPQTACRCLGSSAGELKLSLPDQLATQAKAAGLLTSEAIERIVREAIRKAAAQRLIEYGRRLREPEGPDISEAAPVEGATLREQGPARCRPRRALRRGDARSQPGGQTKPRALPRRLHVPALGEGAPWRSRVVMSKRLRRARLHTPAPVSRHAQGPRSPRPFM